MGESADLKLLMPDDEKTYVDVQIPLQDIKVEFTKGHKKDIKLTDSIMLVMRYPTYELLGVEDTDMTIEKTFKLISDCTEKVIDGETIHERSDFNDKELQEFYDGLDSKQFQNVQNFFETMPRLKHTVEVVNPKTKKKNKITLEGMQSFFG